MARHPLTRRSHLLLRGAVADSTLPAELVRFIHEHIHSVEQLEVLLLLRENPERWWSPEEVSQALRTIPSSASQRLLDDVLATPGRMDDSEDARRSALPSGVLRLSP
jgi:hypothetical protein